MIILVDVKKYSSICYPFLIKMLRAAVWWYMPLIKALGKQREAYLCEFKASLIYRGNSRTASATHKETLSFGEIRTNKT